ncbi:MAG TPA: serine/threonine-protein kinase [Pyrinomonadaceae bacterium]|nr:serine/threonine-protein kinase [Pyrinomonadaceae bacterium]
MLKIGDEIKDFTLVKFLGKGGFGEVWLAEKKIELADKRVPFALKFISSQNQGGIDLETVKREVNTWIEASGNKQVVSVMDGFMHDQMFVIVSEYADGGSLRDWLRANGGKAPTIEKAVELMGGVLDGLTHLHTQKIVHRDLKPENILLKGEVPCIADFGVSRVIETLSFGDSFGTNAAGSPHYMSPESFERIIPSPQVDVWSAGVILYEMLCGKFPYQADTVPALVFEIITKDPKPMPATVPFEIQNVVKKALSKHAVERYASAKEMRDALLKAFYLQDQVSTAQGEELAKSKPTLFAQGNSFADHETLKQPPVKPKKSFAWAYVSGGLLLIFGAIGITIWAFLGNKEKVQENSVVTNQNTNVKPQSNLPETITADSGPQKAETGKDVNASNPTLQTSEKPKVTKTQLVKPPEVTQSKPKQPAKTKEKMTLDKILEKNN